MDSINTSSLLVPFRKRGAPTDPDPLRCFLDGVWAYLRSELALPNLVSGARPLRVSLLLLAWDAGPLAHASSVLHDEAAMVSRLLDFAEVPVPPSLQPSAYHQDAHLPISSHDFNDSSLSTSPTTHWATEDAHAVATNDVASCVYLYVRAPVRVNVSAEDPSALAEDTGSHAESLFHLRRLTLHALQLAHALPELRLRCLYVNALVDPPHRSHAIQKLLERIVDTEAAAAADKPEATLAGTPAGASIGIAIGAATAPQDHAHGMAQPRTEGARGLRVGPPNTGGATAVSVRSSGVQHRARAHPSPAGSPADLLLSIAERRAAVGAALLVSEAGSHWADLIIPKRTLAGKPSAVLADWRSGAPRRRSRLRADLYLSISRATSYAISITHQQQPAHGQAFTIGPQHPQRQVHEHPSTLPTHAMPMTFVHTAACPAFYRGSCSQEFRGMETRLCGSSLYRCSHPPNSTWPPYRLYQPGCSRVLRSGPRGDEACSLLPWRQPALPWAVLGDEL